MLQSNLRPKWWQLYLTFPLLLALFTLDARLKISVRGHQAVQIGIILLVYVLIHIWLKANGSAFEPVDHEQDHGRIRIVRVPVSQLPGADVDYDERPMFGLPALEGKGMLSDTFEMDYIDAEFYPVDEVHQQSKKE